jgi:hypothetical protein
MLDEMQLDDMHSTTNTQGSMKLILIRRSMARHMKCSWPQQSAGAGHAPNQGASHSGAIKHASNSTA